jgi:hypothetical protein
VLNAINELGPANGTHGDFSVATQDGSAKHDKAMDGGGLVLVGGRRRHACRYSQLTDTFLQANGNNVGGSFHVY